MDEIKVRASDLPVSSLPASGQNDLIFSLKSIFSRILRRPHVDEEEDFFDLGGDSIVAIALLKEIEKLTGQALPITALYEASTVSTLARLLTASESPKFSYITLLKPGLTDKPLFIVSGIGGAVIELRDLARLTEIKQAIYGLGAAGGDGTKQTYNRIEDLARFHVENLIAMQPQGPYYLAGYSFGGLVALEMARVLSQTGKTVALLALIDTFPYIKYWPLSQRMAGLVDFVKQFLKIPWLKVVGYYFSTVKSLPLHSGISFVFIRAWRLINFPFDQVRFGFWLNRYKTTGTTQALVNVEEIELPADLQNIRSALLKAFKSYKPKYYPHEITFIRADATSFFNESRYWGKLCAKLSNHVVPGDHQSMVRGNPRPLAVVLGTCVEKASEAADAPLKTQ